MPLLHADRNRDLWDDAAAGWNEQAALIRDWLAGPTATMLDSAAIGPGMRVLDLAAGAGDQSCDIAQRIGATGSLLVTDISPAMLKLAAGNLAAAGHRNARFECFDFGTPMLQEAGFGAAICRLGLMFADDPARVLQSVRAALRPGGRLAALAFSAPPGNPTLGIVMSIALRHAGKPPRDPFQPGILMSLGKPGLLEQLFPACGLRDVTVTRIAASIRAASVEAYLQFVQSAAAPVRDLLNGMEAGARQAARTEMAAALSPFMQGGTFEAGTELLLAVGTA